MVGPATAKLLLPTVLLSNVTASSVASLADLNARLGALRAIAQLRLFAAKPDLECDSTRSAANAAI